MDARRKVELQSKLVATYERRHTNSSDARARLAQLERKLNQFEKILADLTEKDEAGRNPLGRS